MADELAALDRIAEPQRTAIRQYAGLIRDVAGKRAKGLVLFGAIAAGAFDPKRHTIKNLLILDEVDLSILRRLAEHGPKLGRQRISAPVVMTPDYIRSSADAFPLELIEIQQMHLTLFGGVSFDDLTFEDSHVRLQCERELKALLIGLRQGLLASAGEEKFIGAVEVEMGEALMRTLRGMLWLKGQREAKPALEVVAEIVKLTQRSLPGLRTALNAAAAHGWEQFESLYTDVAALAEAADGW
ncbi:MAG: hypothetical protein GY778_31220 [bacterium]|nr:hypothetical protein [bacterium]